jgi:Tol biopolymer transport system component
LLSAGAKVGPYEIQAQVGAGGMGEVYRARDSRLGRDVAIKVLPAAFSSDPDRLRRFEQEARSAAALNHPNIVNIYDVGTHEGSPYLVTELLEGETLRQRIQAGPLSARKATDIALQVTRGLAAAHEKGIVHRDLKPENIFLTKDGRTKILDFGLAKLTRPEDASAQGDAATVASRTEPGLVLGTAGYMSPEQVRGRPADARSDIFSLAAILYEMVSGTRAFRGESPADTMSAILKEEPPPLAPSTQNIPPGLQRIVEHGLEKDAADRFQSARDLGFALEALSGASGASTAVPAVPATAGRPRYRATVAAFALGALLAGTAAILLGNGVLNGQSAPPQFHEFTFRRGSVTAARFAPDGKSIVYSASWDGKPSELFLGRPDSTESLTLGLTDADLLAVSPSGELAVRLTQRMSSAYVSTGTMARMALTGGAPRVVLENVRWADWSPDGKGLAVVRDAGGKSRLEYPVGHSLYETGGWIGDPRFSPDGRFIAFVDHPTRAGDLGSIAVVDLSGHVNTLSTGYDSAQGVAWSPKGDEVWFTAVRGGVLRSVMAVSLAGKERVLARVPGILTLRDVARDGRVLLTRDDWRLGIIAVFPDSRQEQDISWMDFSAVRDLTPDGKLLLFDESGEAGGFTGAIFLRRTDGSPPVRLADGISTSISPDRSWVLAADPLKGTITLVPAGVGEAKPIPASGVSLDWANWLPDGKRFLVAGSKPGEGRRIYLQSVDGSELHPIAPEGLEPAHYSRSVSPDGKSVLALDAEDRSFVCSVDAASCKPIPGADPGEIAFGWTGDGRSAYLYRPAVPAKVYEVNLTSGQRTLWRELNPPDPIGVNFLRPPHISADGKSYAYNYNRILSELFLVEGLK